MIKYILIISFFCLISSCMQHKPPVPLNTVKQDNYQERYRNRFTQLEVKHDYMNRRMHRMEDLTLELTKEINILRQKLTNQNSQISQTNAQVSSLPKLKATAGKTNWTEKTKKQSQKIVKYLVNSEKNPTGNQKKELMDAKLPISRFVNSKGGLLDLSDYEGKKKVLLVILRGFAGSVCLICSSQTIALAEKVDEFKKRNTQVILVYPGEAQTVPGFLESVQELKKDFELPFPIVLDVELLLVKKFKIKGNLAKPTSIIIDEKGIVRYAYVGKNPADRPPVNLLLKKIDKLR